MAKKMMNKMQREQDLGVVIVESDIEEKTFFYLIHQEYHHLKKVDIVLVMVKLTWKLLDYVEMVLDDDDEEVVVDDGDDEVMDDVDLQKKVVVVVAVAMVEVDALKSNCRCCCCYCCYLRGVSETRVMYKDVLKVA